ncbi:MAG: hypothetical protein KJ607_03080, partial [Bacteroidetes bacterium]|nr:hypothetical protein [Bacteroidota bacterium]
MKKSLLLLLATVILSNCVYPQWYYQNSGTTSALYDVFCLNKDTVFAAGDNGIFKTVNGGDAWTNIYSSGAIESIFFVDNNVGYATGTSVEIHNLIIKTVNGGDIWTTLNSGLSSSYYGLNCLYFVNDTIGYIGAANEGILVKTINEGINWDSLNLGQIEDITDIYFINKDTGIITSLYSTYKTYDGANTWIQKNNHGGRDIFFCNDSVGYVSGAFILKTTNSGETWIISDTIDNPQLQTVFFTSLDTGYVAGWDPFFYYGGVYGTTINSGMTWNIDTIPEKITSIYFVNSQVGYAVCEDGTILKTENGGITGNIQEKGINEKTNNIKIFQNYDQIEFIFPHKINKDMSFCLYDVKGNTVKSLNNIFSNKIILNKKNITKGIYIYEIIANNKIIYTDKLFI